MSILDWSVLIASLVFITFYGIWKGRNSKNIENYLLGNKTMPWYAVGLSIMATQASAITFLSAPGQAYTDGMRFVQFYFGLPLAMIVLCITVVPIYHRLNIYTAYEYLESRFDLKTRGLAAFLFLIQRGLAAGLTVYAPSIILSSLFGWDIYLTNLVIGGLVIIYTVAGGTKAVSYTHLGQMVIILSGMFIAGCMVVKLLPEDVSFTDAIHVAGKAGKLNAIDFSFDLNNRYNVWSGLIGGFFLALSYFGTDQSQVGRYLSGSSISESRLGLLFNGIVKIPMQFGILFIGVMLFTFYQFHTPPLFFNTVETKKMYNSSHADIYKALEEEHAFVMEEKQKEVRNLLGAIKTSDESKIAESKVHLNSLDEKAKNIRKQAIASMEQNDPKANTNDVNYIFLNFVINYLPEGIIGLLIAVIFAASMSSTSAELNALASTSVIDIYKRMIRKEGTANHYLNVSRWATVFWGVYAIIVANLATRMGSLIEAVNVLGSLFYGTILGIFLVAFYFKKIKGSATFTAAIIAEIIVIACYNFTEISFLWYNVIGCFIVILGAWIITLTKKTQTI